MVEYFIFINKSSNNSGDGNKEDKVIDIFFIDSREYDYRYLEFSFTKLGSNIFITLFNNNYKNSNIKVNINIKHIKNIICLHLQRFKKN